MKTIISLLFTLVVTYSFSQPMSGLYTIGDTSNYVSITAALNDVKAKGLDSAIVFMLNDYNSSNETFPIVFDNTLGTAANKTITIKVNDLGSYININTLDTFALVFDQASYINIDGHIDGQGETKFFSIYTQDTALSVIHFVNGSHHINIKNCYVYGDNVNQDNGVILFGESTTVEGNHDISISYCDIEGNSNYAVNGIVSKGSAGKPNYNNTLFANLLNYYKEKGIALLDNTGSGWSIKANHFYNINPGSNDVFGVYVNSSLFEQSEITENSIGGTDRDCMGDTLKLSSTGINFSGIYVNASASPSVSINNNRISNISFNPIDAVSFVGIDAVSGVDTIMGNQIRGEYEGIFIYVNATGLHYGIRANAKYIYSNNVSNFDVNGTSGFTAIESLSDNATLEGNIISNIVIHASTLGVNALTGIRINSNNGVNRVLGNSLSALISNEVTSVTLTEPMITGIAVNTSASVTHIEKNQILGFGNNDGIAHCIGVELVSGETNLRNNMISMGVDKNGSNFLMDNSYVAIKKTSADKTTLFYNSINIDGYIGSANSLPSSIFERTNGGQDSIGLNLFSLPRNIGDGMVNYSVFNVDDVSGITSFYNNFTTFYMDGIVEGNINMAANQGSEMYNIATVGGVVFEDLSAWQGVSGQDLKSLNIAPEYYNPIDLHVNNGSGLYAPDFGLTTEDFDGETRSFYSIGADDVCNRPVIYSDFVETTICSGLDTFIVAQISPNTLNINWEIDGEGWMYLSEGEFGFKGVNSDTLWLKNVDLSMFGGSMGIRCAAASDCGYAYSKPFQLHVDGGQVTSLNEEIIICLGDTVQLDAVDGLSFQWSTGETTSLIKVTPIADTTIYITVTKDYTSCLFVDSVKIKQVYAKIDNGLDTIKACEGVTKYLYATGGDTYQWSTGSIYDYADVTIWSTGVYSVTVSKPGCSAVDSVVVEMAPNPSVSISSSSVCEGEPLVLIASGASSYYWSTGDSNDTLIFTSLSPGYYSSTFVVGTSEFGCQSQQVAYFDIYYKPYIFIDNIIPNICFGDSSASITTNNYYFGYGNPIISWNDTTLMDANRTGLKAGTYIVSISDGTCSSADTAIVVDPALNLNINQITICDGQSVFLAGGNQSTAGVYNDTLTSYVGCDSIISTTLIVHPVYTKPINSSICQGQSVLLAGSFQTTSGIYYDTLVNIFGCDSIIETTLTVHPSYVTPENKEICQGDSILIAGSFQTASGVYYDTLQTVLGCDSIIETTLIVNSLPFAMAGADANYCQGTSSILQAFGGVSYAWSPSTGLSSTNTSITYASPTDTTDYIVTVTSFYGCTNVDTVRVAPYVNLTDAGTNVSVCDGESANLNALGGTAYVWSGPDLSSTTIANPIASPLTTTNYYVTISYGVGCTAIDSLTVTVNPVYVTPASKIICQGESVLLAGSMQTTSGVYVDTLQTVLGCDSIIETTLTVNPSYTTPASKIICQGESVLLAGSMQTASGVYIDTLQTVLGCDSIIETTLTVNPSYTTPASKIICQGESVLLAGSMQTTSGIYIDTLQTVLGCDSIIETTLTVNPSYTTPASKIICQGESVLLAGSMQTTSGVYIDTLQTVLGCDSIIETTLTVNPSYVTPENKEICQGDSILIAGSFQTASGVYYDTLQTVLGCDSIIETTLIVNTLPFAMAGADANYCQGTSSILQAFGGVSYAWSPSTGLSSTNTSITYASPTDTTDYIVTVTSFYGCTNVDTVRVAPYVNLTDAGSNVSVCDGESANLNALGGTAYVWSGPNLSSTTIANPIASPLTTTNYYVTISYGVGCTDKDSVVVKVNPVEASSQTLTICQGESEMLEGSLQTTSGIYYDTLATVNGCDSVITTTLVVNPVEASSQTLTICQGESEMLEGSWQTTSGIYRDTLATVHGCDSVITTTLVVNPVEASSQTLTICQGESEMLEGSLQTTSGIYRDTLATVNGCDSVITTTLVVNPVEASSQTLTICLGESEMLEGSWQTTSGIYRDTLATVHGCDSVITTTLIVNPVVTNNVTQTICSGQGVMLEGQLQTASGVYRDTIQDSYGCDSIITITTLIVNPVLTNNVTQTICQGQSVLLEGQLQTIAGIYHDTIKDTYGCDSIITETELVVNSLPVVNITGTTIICQGANTKLTAGGSYSFNWDNGATTAQITVDPTTTTTYTLTVTDANTCSAADSVVVIVNAIDTTAFSFTVTNIYTANFMAQQTGYDLYWNFGDDHYSNDQNPIHKYASAGSFNACLTATNQSNGCVAYQCKDVNIQGGGCNASYTAVMDSLTNKLTLTNTSTVDMDKFYWLLGDGEFTTDKDVVHVYDVEGYYNVTLLADNGNCSDVMSSVIFVGDSTNDCLADFVYLVDLKTNEVNFINQSVYKENASFVWDFGNSQQGNSINALHKYSKGGFYNVCLNVNSAGCKNIVCKEIKASDDTISCNANFTYVINPVNKTVRFKDKSLGNPDKWSWSLGDGTTITTQDVDYTFAIDGFYQVVLTIENTEAQCKDIQNAYLYISSSSPNKKLHGIFTYYQDTLQPTKGVIPVEFKGASYGEASDVDWDFGDGSSNEATTTPTHEYTEPGNYNVCYTVTNYKQGVTDQYCDNVKVVEVSTAIAETEAYSINLWPNPTSKMLNVNCATYNTKANRQLELYSIDGRLIYTFEFNQKHMSINVANLPAGTYYIKMNSEKGVETKKFVKMD